MANPILIDGLSRVFISKPGLHTVEQGSLNLYNYFVTNKATFFFYRNTEVTCTTMDQGMSTT
jgi:hypothetical protein